MEEFWVKSFFKLTRDVIDNDLDNDDPKVIHLNDILRNYVHPYDKAVNKSEMICLHVPMIGEKRMNDYGVWSRPTFKFDDIEYFSRRVTKLHYISQKRFLCASDFKENDYTTKIDYDKMCDIIGWKQNHVYNGIIMKENVLTDSGGSNNFVDRSVNTYYLIIHRSILKSEINLPGTLPERVKLYKNFFNALDTKNVYGLENVQEIKDDLYKDIKLFGECSQSDFKVLIETKLDWLCNQLYVYCKIHLLDKLEPSIRNNLFKLE
jgi:hypothetical protein